MARAASASGTVDAGDAAVFAFLEDLANHWRLAGRWIEVVELHPAGAPARGATVRLRGPVGLRRLVRTEVDEAVAGAMLRGHALTGGSRASVRWEVAADGGERTLVRVEVALVRARATDRLLWAAGGRRWLSARLGDAVGRLDGLLTGDLRIPDAVPTTGS